jgi:hypothetical protein
MRLGVGLQQSLVQVAVADVIMGVRSNGAEPDE